MAASYRVRLGGSLLAALLAAAWPNLAWPAERGIVPMAGQAGDDEEDEEDEGDEEKALRRADLARVRQKYPRIARLYDSIVESENGIHPPSTDDTKFERLAGAVLRTAERLNAEIATATKALEKKLVELKREETKLSGPESRYRREPPPKLDAVTRDMAALQREMAALQSLRIDRIVITKTRVPVPAQ